MTDNKTIGITIRFWTNNQKVEHNEAKAISCWDSGVVCLEANQEKGIKAIVVPFQHYGEIDKAISEAMRKSHILMIKSFRCGRFK
jgi:hypothetical protein